MAAPIVQGFKHFGNQSGKTIVVSNCFTVGVLFSLTVIPKLIYGSTLLYQDALLSVRYYCLLITICQMAQLIIFKNNFSRSKTRRLQVKSAFNSILVILVAVGIFHIVSVLFGAPLSKTVSETFHFSCLLAVLTALPCCCVLGPNLENWSRLFGQNSPETSLESQVFVTTVCSLLGAWLGAIPIPLDWDRWWQEWPITCVCGALLGYENGLVISTVVIMYYSWKQRKSKLV